MNFVVVDKSYLDGTSTAEVKRLAHDNRLIVSAALFHEILTTRPESRVRCLSKLPQTINPVELVERAGNLASLEMERHAPAGLPSANLVSFDGPFRFNPKLLELDFPMPVETAEAIEEKRLSVEESIDALIELSETVPSIFPELTIGTTQQRKEALTRAQSLISDPRNVVGFLADLESPEPGRPFPDISSSPEEWAITALLQARLLFVTDLYVRHQGKLAEIMTPSLRVRLEHDVHDAEVLALGILQGAFATRERKLREWFKLLRPGGKLYPGDA